MEMSTVILIKAGSSIAAGTEEEVKSIDEAERLINEFEDIVRQSIRYFDQGVYTPARALLAIDKALSDKTGQPYELSEYVAGESHKK